MRLDWSNEAVAQLSELRAYIKQHNPQVASAIVARIREMTKTLSEFPQSGQVDEATHTRVLTVPRTPYRLYYVVQADRILIVSVWHGARQWPPSSA